MSVLQPRIALLVVACLVAGGPGCGAPEATRPPPAVAPAGRSALDPLPAGERTLFRALLAVQDTLSPTVLSRAVGRQSSRAALVAAANAAYADGHPELARYLKAVGEVQVEGESAGLTSLARVALEADGLLVVLGSEEAAAHPMTFLEVGRRDPGASEWIEAFERGMEGFAGWLGLSRGERVHPFLRDRVVAGRLLHRGGDRRGGVELLTVLPPDAGSSEEQGRFAVFWTDLMEDTWFQRSVAPFGRELLPRSSHGRLTARAHRRFVVTRFTTGRIGPQASHIDGLDVPFTETLGEPLLAPLVVARDELLATLAHVWLARTGRTPREVEDESLLMLPVMTLYTLAEHLGGGAIAADRRAAAVLIARRLVQAGALEVAGGEQIRVNPAGVRRAAQLLVLELFGVLRSGDQEEARRLLGGRVPAEVEVVLRRVGRPADWRLPLVRDLER